MFPLKVKKFLEEFLTLVQQIMLAATQYLHFQKPLPNPLETHYSVPLPWPTWQSIEEVLGDTSTIHSEAHQGQHASG